VTSRAKPRESAPRKSAPVSASVLARRSHVMLSSSASAESPKTHMIRFSKPFELQSAFDVQLFNPEREDVPADVLHWDGSRLLIGTMIVDGPVTDDEGFEYDHDLLDGAFVSEYVATSPTSATSVRIINADGIVSGQVESRHQGTLLTIRSKFGFANVPVDSVFVAQSGEMLTEGVKRMSIEGWYSAWNQTVRFVPVWRLSNWRKAARGEDEREELGAVAVTLVPNTYEGELVSNDEGEHLVVKIRQQAKDYTVSLVNDAGLEQARSFFRSGERTVFVDLIVGKTRGVLAKNVRLENFIPPESSDAAASAAAAAST
jgi:hypothetical protein